MMKPFAADHPILMHLGRQLRDAVGAGAALAALGLAACGADAQETDAQETADVDDAGGGTGSSMGGSSAGGSASGGSASGGSASGGSGGSSASALEAYSLDSLGCHGPISTSPLYGPQCCFRATCYTPAAGEACVVEPTYGTVPLELPLGSGSCGCAVQEEGRPAITGPFAPNPDAPEPLTAGTCCYVVGSYGCTGRPFVLNGLGRLASVARRDDWGSFIAASRHSAPVAPA